MGGSPKATQRENISFEKDKKAEEQKNQVAIVHTGEFMGSEVFVGYQSRLQLPVKKLCEPPNYWTIISKMIGSDMRRFEMPSEFKEPLSGLQRLCEMNLYADELYTKGATEEDPVKRLAYACCATFHAWILCKFRKRMPFNQMLGETFELVTDRLRFIAEKIRQHPHVMETFHMETDDYWCNTYNKMMKPVFHFDWGRGYIEVELVGAKNVYYKKFDEHISVTKPKVAIRNLMIGQTYFDVEGQMTGLNHKTGEKIVFEFELRSGHDDWEGSKVSAKGYDAKGKQTLEISGSWLADVIFHDLVTGKKTKMREHEPELIPDAHLQFFFNKHALMLNYKNEDMMKAICPTDSRFRQDVRYCEENKLDEADQITPQIDEVQWKVWQDIQHNKRPQWEPRFFKEIKHPHIKSKKDLDTNEGDNPVMWELITGENGYWEKRAKQEWGEQPKIFGPFELKD